MIDNQITVFIPTSPIPSHPSTEIISKVLHSIRFHLPEARIIISADGVRPQVEHRKKQYEDYLQQLSDRLATMEFGNTCMQIWMEPVQQAEMLRQMLDSGLMDTPLVLFVEHDTYLTTTSNPRDEEGTGLTHTEDCPINWEDISDIIASGGVNMVRFYLWEKIWHEHEYLMRGQMYQGESKFIKTVQYSQWPNIASADFYRKILSEHFQSKEQKMIEIGMYGPVVAAPWEDYRIAIYHPEPNARRFFHLNGRADENGVRDACDW